MFVLTSLKVQTIDTMMITIPTLPMLIYKKITC